MRSLLHAIGMCALGAAALAGAGWAYDARVTTPLPVNTEPVAVGTTGPVTFAGARDRRLTAVNTALRGLAADLRAGAEALSTRSDAAAPLLDGSWRVAQVIDFVGARREDHELVRRVEAARRALQNGDPTEASRRAQLAARMADTISPASLRLLATSATYRGALVLDANGNRIGSVVDIDDVRVTIDTPAPTIVLGFSAPRRGTSSRDVPRDSVLLGQPRTAGQTMVLAPLGIDVPAADAALTGRFMRSRPLTARTVNCG